MFVAFLENSVFFLTTRETSRSCDVAFGGRIDDLEMNLVTVCRYESYCGSRTFRAERRPGSMSGKRGELASGRGAFLIYYVSHPGPRVRENSRQVQRVSFFFVDCAIKRQSSTREGDHSRQITALVERTRLHKVFSESLYLSPR